MLSFSSDMLPTVAQGENKLMDTLTRSCCLFVLLALWGAVPARANLVQNGDFAGGGDAGWTFAEQDVHILPGAELVNTPCPGCSSHATFQSVPLNSGFGWFDPIDIGYGTLSQTLVTTPGQRYQISYTFGILGESIGAFFASVGSHAVLPSNAELGLPGNPAPAGYLNHPLGDCSFMELYCGLVFGNAGSLQAPEFSLQSFTWTATSSSSVLEFAGSGPGLNFIVGDVSAVAIPEPASLALLLAALAGGVAVLRGRRLIARPMA